MSQFSQPGVANPEDKFVPKDNNGALLLFFPTQIQHQVKTEYGESDAVHATVVRLNDGRVFPDALIFATALITQLREAIPDGMVLGTLGQGENKKGNPPWLLSPHTADDVAAAERWLAANPRQSFAQPAPASSPAPSAAGWAAPPTAAAPAPAWGQQPATPAPAAPATGGWGNPPSAAPQGDLWGGVNAAPAAAAPASSPGASWGSPQAAAAAPTPPAAPAPAPTATSSPADPGLVEALRKKGVNVPPGTTHEAALGAWAMYQNAPDVA